MSGSVKQISPEILVATNAFLSVGDDFVDSLEHGVVATSRGRMRLCAHRTVDEPIHEMLIALSRDTYIRPHRHIGKSESVHVVEGYGDLVRFDDAGRLHHMLRIGPHGSGSCFYYRMAAPEYHMLIVRSDVLVVHETTNGPFRPSETEFAPWAPEEGDVAGRAAFRAWVEDAIERHRLVHEETA